MKKHLLFALGAAALMPAAVMSAGPAFAAQTYAMPSVKGLNLQEAENAIVALSPGSQFNISSHNIDGPSQKQLDLPLWKVCGQVPKAGSKITVATNIDIAVSRFTDGCDS